MHAHTHVTHQHPFTLLPVLIVISSLPHRKGTDTLAICTHLRAHTQQETMQRQIQENEEDKDLIQDLKVRREEEER